MDLPSSGVVWQKRAEVSKDAASRLNRAELSCRFKSFVASPGYGGYCGCGQKKSASQLAAKISRRAKTAHPFGAVSLTIRSYVEALRVRITLALNRGPA